MPNISTPNSPLISTPLQQFQDTVSESTMSVPATNTDLGHASLALKTFNAPTANGGIHKTSTSPVYRPSKSTPTGGVITRSAI